eukprot:s36_g48.t1
MNVPTSYFGFTRCQIQPRISRLKRRKWLSFCSVVPVATGPASHPLPILVQSIKTQISTSFVSLYASVIFFRMSYFCWEVGLLDESGSPMD